MTQCSESKAQEAIESLAKAAWNRTKLESFKASCALDGIIYEDDEAAIEARAHRIEVLEINIKGVRRQIQDRALDLQLHRHKQCSCVRPTVYRHYACEGHQKVLKGIIKDLRYQLLDMETELMQLKE